MSQLDFTPLRTLNQALARGQQTALEAVLSVAQRVAVEANAYFATRKIPVQVIVRQHAGGATLVISATRRLRRRFSGGTPEGVVREILARHLGDSGEQVALEVARSLR